MLGLRQGEGGLVLRLGGHFFLILAATTIHVTAAEGLFIAAFPPSRLLVAFAAGALLSAAAAVGYEALQRRLPPARLTLAVAGAIGVALPALRFAGPLPLLVAAPVVNAILGIENAALVARSTDPRSARRVLPAVGALGGLGAMLGGAVVGLLSPALGAGAMIWIAAGLVLVSWIPALKGGAAPRRAEARSASWGRVLRHRFALCLLLLVLVAGVLSTTVRYQLGACLKETADPARIAAWLGLVSVAINAASIVFTLALARVLIERLGVGTSFSVYPGAILLAGIGGVVLPGLAAATAAQVAERLLRQNLQRPILGVALLPLPDAVRPKATVAVRGMLEPLSVALASAAILVSGAPWRSLSWAVAGLGLAALAVAWAARRGYLADLTASLHARRLRFPDDEPAPVDAAAREVLHRYLRSELPDRVALALHLLRGRETAETHAILRERGLTFPEPPAALPLEEAVRQLDDDRTFVRAREALLAAGPAAIPPLRAAATPPALEILGELGDDGLAGFLRRPELRFAAARGLLKRGLRGEAERAAVREAALEEPDLECVFALVALLHPERPLRRMYLCTLVPDARQRAFALEALDEALPADWRSRLLPRLEAPVPEETLPEGDELRAAILRRPRLGPLWLRSLALRLPRAAAAAVSGSGGSIATRAMAADAPDDVDVWHRMFALRAVPLFAGLSSESLQLVAGISRRIPAEPGEILVREGRPGHHFYVVASGVVEVSAGGAQLAMLGEGEAFGEIALLTGELRSATVRAVRRCELLTIERVDFLDLLETHPTLVRPLGEMIVRRIRGDPTPR
jgi:hypothetical protein